MSSKVKRYYEGGDPGNEANNVYPAVFLVHVYMSGALCACRSGVVRGGEGGVFEFWNIRVSRRTNPAR